MTAFRVFQWTYIVAIFCASVQTALSSEAIPIRVLGMVEAIVVLLLPYRPARLLGLVALLMIFAIATAHEIASGGGIPFRFAIYGAGAWLVAMQAPGERAAGGASSAA